MCHVLDKPRAHLYTWPESTPTELQQSTYKALIERRTQGEPLAYLTGVKEFWSHTFFVTPDTLIPRPETELLVELSISKLRQHPGPFLDLGTGSGVIAICVAKELPETNVMAVDNSNAALEVALSNARQLRAGVSFRQSNWFEQLSDSQFAVIAANPPYIADNDPHLERDGLPHEPINALRSCDNGMADITAIITQASAHLRHSGWLLIEHGHDQGLPIRTLMEESFNCVETIKDLAHNDRVTLGQIA